MNRHSSPGPPPHATSVELGTFNLEERTWGGLAASDTPSAVLRLHHALLQTCDSSISSISGTWEPVRNADSHPHPRTRSASRGARNLCFDKRSRWFCFRLKFENHCFCLDQDIWGGARGSALPTSS